MAEADATRRPRPPGWSLLLLLVAACAGPADPVRSGDDTTLQRRLAEAERDLVTAVGPASCSNVDQCVAVPIGHKACGGPADHLAYSTVGTDAARVNALAAEHRTLARQLNILRGAMSDCALVEPAPLACVAQRCQFVGR